MLSLGTRAPHFSLKGIDDTVVSLNDFQGKNALVVVFYCNHCPYVKMLKKHFAEFAQNYMAKDVGFVAINSNDTVQYPDDSLEKMKEDARQFSYPFSYLLDADQSVAKTYRAACTPDFYLFNGDMNLVYRGQYDDARPGNDQEVTGRDLAMAIDLVLAGEPVPQEQNPAVGCNIKWKPGNAPDYFA
jgi:peroxiredoxin